MLKNLDRLLRSKGISKRDYAAFLGVTEKTIQNKIAGRTAFSYPEVVKTRKYLLPEYDQDYLFESTEDTA